MEAQPKISKNDPKKKNSIQHAQNAQQVQKGLQSWRERIETSDKSDRPYTHWY